MAVDIGKKNLLRIFCIFCFFTSSYLEAVFAQSVNGAENAPMNGCPENGNKCLCVVKKLSPSPKSSVVDHRCYVSTESCDGILSLDQKQPTVPTSPSPSSEKTEVESIVLVMENPGNKTIRLPGGSSGGSAEGNSSSYLRTRRRRDGGGIIVLDARGGILDVQQRGGGREVKVNGLRPPLVFHVSHVLEQEDPNDPDTKSYPAADTLKARVEMVLTASFANAGSDGSTPAASRDIVIRLVEQHPIPQEGRTPTAPAPGNASSHHHAKERERGRGAGDRCFRLRPGFFPGSSSAWGANDSVTAELKVKLFGMFASAKSYRVEVLPASASPSPRQDEVRTTDLVIPDYESLKGSLIAHHWVSSVRPRSAVYEYGHLRTDIALAPRNFCFRQYTVELEVLAGQDAQGESYWRKTGEAAHCYEHQFDTCIDGVDCEGLCKIEFDDVDTGTYRFHIHPSSTSKGGFHTCPPRGVCIASFSQPFVVHDTEEPSWNATLPPPAHRPVKPPWSWSATDLRDRWYFILVGVLFLFCLLAALACRLRRWCRDQPPKSGIRWIIPRGSLGQDQSQLSSGQSENIGLMHIGGREYGGDSGPITKTILLIYARDSPEHEAAVQALADLLTSLLASSGSTDESSLGRSRDQVRGSRDHGDCRKVEYRVVADFMPAAATAIARNKLDWVYGSMRYADRILLVNSRGGWCRWHARLGDVDGFAFDTRRPGVAEKGLGEAEGSPGGMRLVNGEQRETDLLESNVEPMSTGFRIGRKYPSSFDDIFLLQTNLLAEDVVNSMGVGAPSLFVHKTLPCFFRYTPTGYGLSQLVPSSVVACPLSFLLPKHIPDLLRYLAPSRDFGPNTTRTSAGKLENLSSSSGYKSSADSSTSLFFSRGRHLDEDGQNSDGAEFTGKIDSARSGLLAAVANSSFSSSSQAASSSSSSSVSGAAGAPAVLDLADYLAGHPKLSELERKIEDVERLMASNEDWFASSHTRIPVRSFGPLNPGQSRDVVTGLTTTTAHGLGKQSLALKKGENVNVLPLSAGQSTPGRILSSEQQFPVIHEVGSQNDSNVASNDSFFLPHDLPNWKKMTQHDTSQLPSAELAAGITQDADHLNLTTTISPVASPQSFNRLPGEPKTSMAQPAHAGQDYEFVGGFDSGSSPGDGKRGFDAVTSSIVSQTGCSDNLAQQESDAGDKTAEGVAESVPFLASDFAVVSSIPALRTFHPHSPTIAKSMDSFSYFDNVDDQLMVDPVEVSTINGGQLQKPEICTKQSEEARDSVPDAPDDAFLLPVKSGIRVVDATGSEPTRSKPADASPPVGRYHQDATRKGSSESSGNGSMTGRLTCSFDVADDEDDLVAPLVAAGEEARVLPAGLGTKEVLPAPIFGAKTEIPIDTGPGGARSRPRRDAPIFSIDSPPTESGGPRQDETGRRRSVSEDANASPDDASHGLPPSRRQDDASPRLRPGRVAASAHPQSPGVPGLAPSTSNAVPKAPGSGDVEIGRFPRSVVDRGDSGFIDQYNVDQL